MIQAKFGLPGIALRTLEVYTTATLEATLTAPRPVEPPMAHDHGARGRRGARRFPPHGLRRSALPALFQRRHAGSRARRAAHRQPSGAAQVVAAACRRCAPFPGSSPGRRPGCCSPRGSASTKCSAKACPTSDRDDLPADVSGVAVLPLDHRPDGDGARQGGCRRLPPTTTAISSSRRTSRRWAASCATG